MPRLTIKMLTIVPFIAAAIVTEVIIINFVNVTL